MLAALTDWIPLVWERSPHPITFSSPRSALRHPVSPSITRAQDRDAHPLDQDGHIGAIFIYPLPPKGGAPDLKKKKNSKSEDLKRG